MDRVARAGALGASGGSFLGKMKGGLACDINKRLVGGVGWVQPTDVLAGRGAAQQGGGIGAVEH
jgi:hypothetical protein